MKKAISSVLGSLDIGNDLIHLGMDGPNVNFAVQHEVEDMKSNDNAQLLDIGSCVLHVLHGAYKAGQKATTWNVKGLLQAAYC